MAVGVVRLNKAIRKRMKTSSSGSAARTLLVALGIIPTALLTIYFGGLLTLMGIGALSEGERMGAFFLAWVFAGVFGLVALGRGAARFDAADFRLKRWESAGLICGFLACLPLPFFIYPLGVVHLTTLWIYLPITSSAIAGIVVIGNSKR
jgi:hypothetical protein